MVGEDDALIESKDVPEISAFFGLVPDHPTKAWARPDGTGVTVFPDVSHCMMVDPFWHEVAERTLGLLDKFETKEQKKNAMASSLAASLNKKAAR